MGGMPASRDSYFRDRTVSEEKMERNWERAFGRTGPNRELKSEFERPQTETRHMQKSVNDLGETK